MGLVAGVPLLHCHVTHVSFPVPVASPALTRALFEAHSLRAWAAASHSPLQRALAVVTAALATGEVQQQAHLVGFLAGVAGALGCDVKALGDALEQARIHALNRFRQEHHDNSTRLCED